jgi:hypothetical protein
MALMGVSLAMQIDVLFKGNNLVLRLGRLLLSVFLRQEPKLNYLLYTRGN